VNIKDDDYCIFDPSEIRELAMHATDLYFANLSDEMKRALSANPVKFTTFYAKIYADTIKSIEEDDTFREHYSRR
jgi:hypothetical protein